MLTYNDVARNFEPRVHHSNILKLGIPKRRWRTLELAFWRGPQQHFGKCRIEKVNGAVVLMKDTRSSETEKADTPQPIKEIQREDPIEASSVWGNTSRKSRRCQHIRRSTGQGLEALFTNSPRKKHVF